MLNWTQIGEDFRQKYEGTFCRFESPLTKEKEIFQIVQVVSYPTESPDLTLRNKRHGDIFLKYTTEAELDFSYPDIGYFQHRHLALRFLRQYERQWKKGICRTTTRVQCPMNEICTVVDTNIDEPTLVNAFIGKTHRMDDALNLLKQKQAVSVAVSKSIAVSLSNTANEYLVWFENEPVGKILGDERQIKVIVPEFTQEIKDYIRNEGDYGRAVV